MDKKELLKKVDHKRWLMNNQLFDDTIKNDLFFYGSISHPAVKAVEFRIDAEKKTVTYDIYLMEKDFKLTQKFLKLSKSNSFIGLWRYKNMLRKYGTLDPSKHVNAAIKDFCGASWSATANVKSFDEYDPSPYKEDEGGEFGPGANSHQPANQG